MATILLTNADMTYRGGTQAWVRQMHRTLSADHSVDVFTLSEHPADLPAFDPTKHYDLALINHWTTAKALRGARIGKRLHTVHGVIPFEEVPVLGADAYVAVSEAVQAAIPFRSWVIRNPIDVAHFNAVTTVAPRPRRVAFVSNRQGDALPILGEACEVAGLELRVVGKEWGVDDPQPVYEWADIVVGIARVAMEALACRRNVLCFDYQGFHGMVTADRMGGLWRSNFGGHERGAWPTAAEVAEVLLGAYDAARDLRPLIVEHHSPEVVADAYLALADATRTSAAARLVRRLPAQAMSPKITRWRFATRCPLR